MANEKKREAMQLKVLINRLAQHSNKQLHLHQFLK